MRLNAIVALALICMQACKAQPRHKEMVYSWFGLETIPKGPFGEINGAIKYDLPHTIKEPGDKFKFYGNYDSIRVKFPDMEEEAVFKKETIPALKWKPAPQYGNKYFFIGTYTNVELPGVYFSFYLTKDQKSLMELEYTNPGNLMAVFFFATDSVNALHKGLVDAEKEIPEAEMPVEAH